MIFMYLKDVFYCFVVLYRGRVGTTGEIVAVVPSELGRSVVEASNVDGST